VSTAFNISKGKIQWYWEQAAAGTGGTGAGLVVILLSNSGLEADDVLNNYDNAGALIAGANTESGFTNYVRKTVQGSGITVTVDDTGNRVLLDLPDQTWSDAGGAANETVSKVLIAYDASLGTGSDTDLVPLIAHDINAITDGNDLIVRFHSDGSARVN
jgi:hypothetical protein